MVKRTLTAVLLVFSVLTPVFADGFDFFFGTVVSVTGTKNSKIDDITNSVSAEADAEVTFTQKNLKADIKGTVSFNSEEKVAEFNLEKIFLRYRFKSINSNYLTITAGKFPSSWGVGYVDGYKISDIITPEDDEYSVSLSQSFDGDWQIELQGVLPFYNEEIFKLGLQARKDFSLELLKGARASVIYNPTESIILFSCAAELYYWTDFTVGTDFFYYYDKNASVKSRTEIAASALKDFSISTETKDYMLMDAIALKICYDEAKFKSTSIINKASMEVSDRLEVSLSTGLTFTSSPTYFMHTADVTYKIDKGLKADCLLSYLHVENNDTVMLSATITFNH